MPEFRLAGPDATERLGAALGGLLRAGDVVALSGELGAGKTSLARGLVRALAGADADVPSPTYTLVQSYELGWRDMGSGVMVVEWPDRAGVNLPHARLDVVLGFDGEGRTARLSPLGEAWQDRLKALETLI